MGFNEIIKVIEISEIMAYIEPIHATYRNFTIAVKPQARKVALLANKKGKSIR